MKRVLFHLVCILIAVFSGVQSFLIKYQVIEKEDALKQLYRTIADNQREVHMLRAEWVYLNDPERLKLLVQTQTQFQPITAQQVLTVSDFIAQTADKKTEQP